MEITVLSLAGSLLASVRAEPEWSISRLISAVKDGREALWPHMKLVHNGQMLKACQKIVEIGLFGGDLLHAVLLRGPQPGAYTGGLVSQEEQAYVRTRYLLTVHEDCSFVLQRVVSSDLGWVLPDATAAGLVGTEAEFEFQKTDDDWHYDVDLEAVPRGVQLTTTFDEVDGGSVRRCITLKRQN